MTVKFSIKDDLVNINAGGFWCSGCLSGQPAREQSTDPHYCLDCFGIVEKEVENGTLKTHLNEVKASLERRKGVSRLPFKGKSFITNFETCWWSST